MRWLKLFFLAVLVLSSTTASARFTASLLPRERLEEKGFSEKLSLLEKAAQVLEKSRIEAEPPTCSLSPFGELIRSSGPLAQANPFRFSTKYWDQESDLVYYGFRYYSPSLGRWISRDPIDEDDGPNIYAFVKNGSVNDFDPFGLSSGTLADTEAAMGGGGGLGGGSGAQAIGFLNRVRDAVDAFNTVQELGAIMMDGDPENDDDILMATLLVGAELLTKGFKKKAAVIGHVKDLDPFKQTGAYDWFKGWKNVDSFADNMRRNTQWLNNVVKKGQTVVIASGKVRAGSITQAEIKYLKKHGYVRIGSTMVKKKP